MAKFWADVRNIIQSVPLPIPGGLSISELKSLQAQLAAGGTVLTPDQIEKILSGQASISERGVYVEFPASVTQQQQPIPESRISFISAIPVGLGIFGLMKTLGIIR